MMVEAFGFYFNAGSQSEPKRASDDSVAPQSQCFIIFSFCSLAEFRYFI